jgi:hypothetical protein
MPPEGASGSGGWPENIRKSAVWLASGVGVAAIVAALGGAALFVRFWTARIPAAEALTVVPNAELIVRGAMALAFYLVLGGAAVAVVWLLDPQGQPGRGTIVGLLGVVVAEMLVPVWTAANVPDAVRILITVGLVAAWVLGSVLLPKLRRSENEPDPPADRRGKPIAELRDWLTHDGRWLAVGLIAGELFVVALIAIFYPTLGLTLLVAGLLLFALLRVAALTHRRFAPYAVALFVAVVLFGAVAIALRALDQPQARPVAVLVNNDARGICGLYVTETDKRLYIAQVDIDHHHDPVRRTGRIIEIPRDKIIAESVGDLQKVSHAYRRAREMRNGLILARPPTTAPQDSVVTTTTRRGPNGEQTVQQVTSKRPAPVEAGGTGDQNTAALNAPCATAKVTPRLK